MSWIDERISGSAVDMTRTLDEMGRAINAQMKDLSTDRYNVPTVEQAYELATMARRLEKVCHQHWTYRDVEDHAPAPGQPLEDPSKASLYLTVAQRDATIKRLEDELGRGARDA